MMKMSAKTHRPHPTTTTLPMIIIWLVLLVHFSSPVNGAKNCSQNKSPSCKFAKTCWDGKVYLALGVVASAYIPKLLPHIGSGGLSALHWAIYQSARVLRAKNIEPIGEFKLKSPTTPPPPILPTSNEEEEEEGDRLLLPVLAILLFALLCALLLLWSCYCRGQSAERWTALKETAGQHFSRFCPCCPIAAQEGEEEEKGNTAASTQQQQQQQIAGYAPGEMLPLIMEAPAENGEQPFDAWPKRGKSKKTKKKKKKRKTTSPLLFESSVTTEEASSSEVPKKHKKKSRSRKS